MNPRVFISHKQEDSATAAEVAGYIRIKGGLDVYLDLIDTQFHKSGPDLADYIRSQIEGCTQLLAILTSRTKDSWWVPWEIGIATEKERFLASYVSPGATIPEFLHKWPYLRSDRDLDLYIQESKRAQRLVEDRKHYSDARGQGFRSFHNSLRASLGQGR